MLACLLACLHVLYLCFICVDEALHALASEKVANDMLLEEEMEIQTKCRQIEQRLSVEHDDKLMVEEELISAKVYIHCRTIIVFVTSYIHVCPYMI